MSVKDMNERVGAAIQRAAGELPEGYDLTIEIERNAGSVVLWIPPVSDEEGGRRVTDFCGDDLADWIESAIGMAVEHHEETYNAKITGADRRPC